MFADSNVFETPKQGFEHYCARCHIKGYAGAPMMSFEPDEQDALLKEWQHRWDKGGKKRFMHSLKQGRGKMPKGAGCFACTDQDFERLVDYIIEFNHLK